MGNEVLSANLQTFIEKERGEPFWAVDSNETRYTDVLSLWTAKASVSAAKEAGMKFWSNHEATHMGVTGLEEEDLQADLAHTSELVSRLLRARDPALSSSTVRCLSVCSGIGREAVGGLIPGGCTTVDLLEAQPHMIEAAKKNIPPSFQGAAYNENAEDHDFEAPGVKYDVLFVGWCVQHIPDTSLVTFLSRAATAVNHNGLVIIKDNVSDFADAVYNDENHFVIRSAAYINALFYHANEHFERLFVERVPQWPGNMFPYKALVWAKKSEVEGWKERLGLILGRNDL